MNLVVGATGALGSEICRLLSAQNLPVRALVRSSSDQQNKEVLRRYGAEIAEGDLRDRSSLASACRGVTNILSTATTIRAKQAGDSFAISDQQGHLQLIDEAEKAGVNGFVFISFPPIPLEFPLQTAKRAVEERLKKSNLNYTILQPSLFQEVWLGPHLGFDAANGKARIYGSGQNKSSWISFLDVEKFAFGALQHGYAANKTIPLGGPQALSPLEVVGIFEEVKGMKWELEFVPEAALQQQYESAVDPTQKTFVALMLGYAYGLEVPMTEVLENMPLQLQLQSVRQFAEKEH